jgi:hypothetical protein
MTWYLNIDRCVVDSQTKQNNVVLDALNHIKNIKEKNLQVWLNVRAIFAKECNFKCRIKEMYV